MFFNKPSVYTPMGTDCAPLIADLFLFSFEFDFMKKLICTDVSVARKSFRYIDDY